MVKFDKTTHPNCFKGYTYAQEVIEGKIVSCKYIVGACKRFLRDLESKEFYFNIDWTERFLRVVQQLEHPIGEWATKNIVYEPWQCWMWMASLGFFNKETGSPKYRVSHIEVPRGNAKSTCASQVALYFLALDTDKGNQLAAVATRKEQARIILDGARVMARKSKSYLRATGVKVLAHTLVHEKSNSKMVALSSDHSGLDGLNLRVAFLDELHAMRRETFEVILSGQSKRKDSITMTLTTAGFNVDGIGHSQSSYAKRVALGDVEDEQFFSAVYTIDEGDDIFEESTWKKANPNYGVSVDPITFKAKADKAKVTPSDLPNFKVKHLNIWLSEATAFFDMTKWDLCADPELKLESFYGKQCVAAIDMASKIDLTSFVMVFKEKDIYYIFDKSYVPEEMVNQLRNTLYDNSIAQGYLISTPGEAIQYERIKADILELSKKIKIQDLNFDPWNATQLGQDLIRERLNCVEFRMTTANLSEPTKTLDALIRQGKIRHNGSPMMRWCFSNIVCKPDAVDNVFPKKSHDRLKIDIAIATIMAMATHIQNEKKASVYEARGLRIM